MDVLRWCSLVVTLTRRAPTEQVVASAQQNLQHHAAGGSVPGGRSRSSAGSGASSGIGGSGAGGSGAGRAGCSAGDGADGGDDDDDDEQDASFRNFYSVTPQQRVFNLEAKDHFKSNAANLRSAIARPKDVLKAGCDRDLIGVGACHVHAPHLYLGLPKPPCPKHGWCSVDKGCIIALGRTTGTAELPGPAGPMPPAVRHPAVLSDLSDDSEDESVGAAARQHTQPAAPAQPAAPVSFACSKCGHPCGNAGGLQTHLNTCGMLSAAEKAAKQKAEKARRAEHAKAVRAAKKRAREEGQQAAEGGESD